MEEYDLPDELKPISVWKYVGLFFLSAVPCVGIICTIVFACGAIKNKNITNFARAQLIVIAIVFAIYLLMFLLGFGAGVLQGIAESIH